MDLFTIILIILGLVVFEVINSVDNAIINAEVLSTMQKKSRKWFLFFGMFFAVFVVRGILPWLIIWFANPAIGPVGAFTSSFSANPKIYQSILDSSPIILVSAATFLLFLFFHWLFLEPKRILLAPEKFFQSYFFFFYAFVSLILSVIVWFASKHNHFMAFGAVMGATAFYIVEALRRYAEESSKRMKKRKISDLGKILYLEVLDASFSIDGVTGAFAFTLSVPLILLGNGIGALVVRHLTIRNANTIHKYKFLKEGAMYSILLLGIIMLFEAFGYEIPIWIPPVITFAIVGYFYYKSRVEIERKLYAEKNISITLRRK